MVDLQQILAPYFPIGEPPVELTFVDARVIRDDASGEPAARATIRLANYERANERERWQLMDLKEQEVYIGWPVLYENRPRVDAFMAALREAFATLDLDKARTLMPHDVFRSDVLMLKRATTQAQFYKALLTSSRLGQFADPDVMARFWQSPGASGS